MTSFPEQLSAFRKKHQVSFERLARELNVSYTTVRAWEKGLHAPTYVYKLALEKLIERYENIDKQK